MVTSSTVVSRVIGWGCTFASILQLPYRLQWMAIMAVMFICYYVTHVHVAAIQNYWLLSLQCVSRLHLR